MLYPKIIVIAGPTASGKTSLGIDLALKFNGEIISADSRQVFRGLDVGSGKVKKSETKGIPHHLIDILSPEEKYNVYKFQKDCLSLIDEISSRGKLPIIVGGTGLYIESVIEQYKFTQASSPLDAKPASTSLPCRERLREGLLSSNTLSNTYGWGESSQYRDLKLTPFAKKLRKEQTKQEKLLWSKLRNNQLGVKFRRQYPIQGYILDFYSPELKLAIEADGGQHQKNKEYDQQRTEFLNSIGVRVLRFWNNEITDNLELVLTKITEELKKPSPNLSLGGRGKDAGSVQIIECGVQKLGLRPNALVLNLNPERETIKLNIQKRLISRLENEAMLQEVQNLITSGISKTWLKSLGLEYKFLTQYIEGEFNSQEEMLAKLNTESWHFAKRQITFLKRWSYAHKIKSQKEALSLVKDFLEP